MPKVRGPKDGNIVTAVFPGKSNGKAKSRFPSLLNTKDLVLLSISGNEYCTREYLDSLVQYAVDTHSKRSDNTLPEGKTTFLIADEIFWHNLKELPPKINDEAVLKAQALNMGDQFFLDNLACFLKPLSTLTEESLTIYTDESLTTSTEESASISTEELATTSAEESETTSTEEPLSKEKFLALYGDQTVDQQIAIINELARSQNKNFEIMRWNTWVNQAKATEKINAMMPLYESESGLKVSLDADIANFISRHGSERETAELWSYRSRAYLTEENPAIMWLAALLEYNFIIYPGKILSSFSATKDFFIVKNHKATVSDGKSIEDSCSHNPLSLHVPEPSRLVNWLEPDFVRSHSITPPPLAADALLNHSFFAQENANPIRSKSEDVKLMAPSILAESQINEEGEPATRSAQISIDGTVVYTSHTTSSGQYAGMEAFFAGILFALNSDKKKENQTIVTPVSNQSDESFAELLKQFTANLLKIDIPVSDKLNILCAISGSLANDNEIKTTELGK